jgi:SAM-dependent methyltransferase
MTPIDHDNLEEFQDPILYDLEERYWEPDGPFVEALARETGGPVLDLACGSGRLAIPLAERGFGVIGVDLAPPMIERAKQKAAAAGAAVRFVHGDARTVRLEERFGLVVMSGNAFQAFLTDGDRDALLETVAAHLADGGLFVFGVRAPVAEHLATNQDEEVCRRYATPDGRGITASGWQRYDPDARVQHWTTHRRWRDANGQPTAVTTRIAIRYAPAAEIVAALRRHNLAVRSAHDSWSDAPLSPTSAHMVFVCARA